MCEGLDGTNYFLNSLLPFHMYPNPCSPALHDRIRHGGAGRINHGDQTSEAEAGGGEVHLIGVKTEASGVLFLIQIQVTETCGGKTNVSSQELSRDQRS